jgi:hypothetical protein
VHETAKGTITALLPWFLSEHALHGITFLSFLLGLLGFLYLSYDLLGRPQGVLRFLLVVLTHLGLSILALLVFAPLILFLFQVVSFSPQIGDIIVFTVMVSVLQGTLIALPHQSRTVKRVQWRDAFIGFLFGLVFFWIDEYVVFQTPLNDWKDELIDFLFFVFLGVVGAGFWCRYGHSLHNATTSSLKKEEGAPQQANKMMQGKEELLPTLFSFPDFIRGLLFWYIVGALAIILWAVLYIRLYGLDGILLYLVDWLIGVAPAVLVCGSSQYIIWRMHRLGEKQLGVIGAIMTIIGYLIGLIEPLTLFLRTH